MNQLKYAFLLIISIIGNPFYQMGAYLICDELNFGSSERTNVFQVNLFVFTLILVLIFLVRLFIYTMIFSSKEYPFSVKGNDSFLYLFAERHLFQGIGLISFLTWASPLEGNIIGFIVVPLTLLLGLVLSIITFIRILKMKKILSEENEVH
jgi:hypothetical protein